MKRRTLFVRHGVQILVVLFLILVPLLVQYRVFLVRSQLEPIRQQASHTWGERVILGLDQVVRGRSRTEDEEVRRQTLVDRLGTIGGNHWSAKLGTVSLTDPLAALESGLASRRLTQALLLGILIPVVGTLVLGRVFCSWICPAGLLFEGADKLRGLLARVRLGPRNVPFWRGNKYALLGVGALLAFLFGIPLLGYFYPPALLGREVGQVVDGLVGAEPGTGRVMLGGGVVFLLGIILTEVFVSRRAWCRAFCPGGALYSLIGQGRLVGLRKSATLCTECHECVKVCPMGLNPMADQVGMECDLCLHCRAVCAPGALSVGRMWPRPSNPRVIKQTKG